MKKMIRFTACALTAALACQCALPAFAAEVSKQESVFVNLDADGTVSKQSVSEWVHAEQGLQGVADESDLTDIVNLKSDLAPLASGRFLAWDTYDTDVYYQGESQGELPVTAAVTYRLDGKTVTAEEAMGQSGHLTIQISLTNHSTRTVEIDGAPRTIPTPFVTVIGCNLPADNFKNVQAQHGIVENDSSNQLVAFVAMPGLQSSLSGLLSGRLSGIKDYLLDEVTIEADVTDLSVPSILIGYSCDATLLSGDASSADTDALFDDIDKLGSATDELVSGGKKLSDGAADLLSGAAKLSDGVSDLSSGAANLSSGLTALNSNSAQLTNGAAALAAGILDSANTQLSAALTAGGYQGTIPTLTYDNYAAALDAILGESGAQASAAALASLKAAIDPSGAMAASSVNAVLFTANRMVAEGDARAMAELVPDAGAKAANAGEIAGVQAALAAAGGFYSLPQAAAVLTPMAIGAIMQQQNCDSATAQGIFAALPAQQQSAALQAAFDGVKAVMDPGSQYDDATLQLVFADAAVAYAASSPASFDAAAFAALLPAAKQKAVDAQYVAAAPQSTDRLAARAVELSGALQSTEAALAGLKTTLAGVQSFVSGLSAYTGGVATAAAGAAQLNAGALTAKQGAQALASGAATLADGAATLSGGLVTYREDGISKLTDAPELANTRSALAVLDEIQKSAESYGSYAGAPEGAKVDTRFVMKTSVPKTAAKAAATTEQTSAKTGFWQRVKDLFTK